MPLPYSSNASAWPAGGKVNAVPSNSGKINAVLEAVQQFASSYGLQPFRVIVLKDPAVINAIQPLASEHLPKSNYAQLLIFAIRTSISKAQIDNYISGIASRKKASSGSLNSYNKYLSSTINNEDQEGKNWAAKQVGLALNHLNATAARLKVPITLLHGVNLARVDKILGFKEKQLLTVAAVSLDNDSDLSAASFAQLPKDKEMIFEFI